MSSNENAQQQGKGVADATTNRGQRVGINESQISNQRAGDEHILLTSQQHLHQQQPFYQQPGAQQYTMYPSGLAYSIDPSQAATNSGGLDYTLLSAQPVYQYQPVYYSSETFQHQPHAYQDPYQTSSSTQFQQNSDSYTPLQTAQYSGAVGYNMNAENPSQNYAVKNNAAMFDNTAAKYTADWVSRTTLIPSEMKVPPDQPGDVVSHDSAVITPKNWGEGSYVVTTTTASMQPQGSATLEQKLPPLDQQLAQLDITSYPFIPSQISHNPHQQYAAFTTTQWPGTSQHPQQQYREQNSRAYSASTLQKSQNTSYADIVQKDNKGSQQLRQQQQQPIGVTSNFHDQRGTQSAQPVMSSQIRYEKSFSGPKTTFNQIGANNSNVRNANRFSGGNVGNRGNFARPNSNRPGQQQQQRSQNPQFSAPLQQRAPIPSLLATQRTQNFTRNNFNGNRGGQGHTNYGGNLTQQMPEFNPGVPPPALPNQRQFRPTAMPPMIPPFLAPPPPPPPFNLMNPHQQQQFLRAYFSSQIRPDPSAAMIPPPFAYDQYNSQRFFNPGFPYIPGGAPISYGQFNRFPNFNRGQRRGGRGARFQQQPRRGYQDQTRFSGAQKQASATTRNSNEIVKPLDAELADSVNRGADFDRDETKTPEPKGDTETTGSPLEESHKKDSIKEDDDDEEEEDSPVTTLISPAET